MRRVNSLRDSYAEKKLHDGVSVLIGTDTLEARIKSAGHLLLHIDQDDIPDQHKIKFGSLRAAVARLSNVGAKKEERRPASLDEQKAVAMEFLELYKSMISNER